MLLSLIGHGFTPVLPQIPPHPIFHLFTSSQLMPLILLPFPQPLPPAVMSRVHLALILHSLAIARDHLTPTLCSLAITRDYLTPILRSLVITRVHLRWILHSLVIARVHLRLILRRLVMVSVHLVSLMLHSLVHPIFPANNRHPDPSPVQPTLHLPLPFERLGLPQQNRPHWQLKVPNLPHHLAL
jgi:hypothetical protein